MLAGFSFETAERKDIEVESQGFITDVLPNTASASTPTTTENTGTEWALWSTFGRLNYNFSNRYIVEGSIRRDGSSRFGENNRFGIFWSVSGGWLISEEDFFQSDKVNFLKLTSSYGIAGNDKITNFASLGLFAAGNDYNGNPGLEASQPANPDLTWEETAQFDINLDAHFFNSRLRLEASWYNKKTTDLLLALPVPETTGFPDIDRNVGELKNTGVDIILGGDIIDNNDFKWTLSANVGFLDNEVTSLPGASLDPFGNEFVNQAAFSSQRAVVGKTVNEWFLIRYAGINPDTGDPQWLTVDGEITNTPTSDDRVYVGSAIPDISGGITSTLTYKGIDFRVFANFVSGGKTYLADNEFSNNIAASGVFNQTRDVLNYWRQPGDNAFAPSLSSAFLSSFDRESTLHLFDSDYLRIKNITLGYSLPESILASTKFITRARIYVQAQNAFTLFSDLKDEEGTDPEVSNGGVDANSAQAETFFTSPQARTFTVGVSLGF